MKFLEKASEPLPARLCDGVFFAVVALYLPPLGAGLSPHELEPPNFGLVLNCDL